jgi:basic membrane protein A
MQCQSLFRVGVVTDVTGASSTGGAAVDRGARAAVARIGCARGELISSSRPSRYEADLEAAAGHGDDLVIGTSFLLADAIMQAAARRPSTHFLLVDPIVMPPSKPNLRVLTFRYDQSAFMAGALAALLSKSGTVGGVYGPGTGVDQQRRLGFERGAAFVLPGIRVLGAYQPADPGKPYQDPSWGAAQARAFIGQHADVIFGAGGAAGSGALLGADKTGAWCIAADLPATDSRPGCLVAGTTTSIDFAVEAEIVRSSSSWAAGIARPGFADGAVGIETFGLEPAIQRRLAEIQKLVSDGQLPSRQ